MNDNKFIEEDPPQPDFDSGTSPKTLNKTRSIDGVTYVAGLGNKDKARVMFIAPSLLKEEGATTAPTVTGSVVNIKPCYLKGAAGTTLLDCMSNAYLNFDEECYYTAVCKWLLPRANRLKPTKQQLNWGMDLLNKEINQVNPDIIVCMGKTVFDLFVKEKYQMRDARGAWFYSEQYKTRLYLMEDVTKLSSKPEVVPTFVNDCTQIRRMLDKVDGLPIEEVKQHYQTINNAEELQEWTDQMIEEGHTIFSLDCEWGGITHVDGDLRSMQLAWKPGHAIYIRFRDDEGNYAFGDCDYAGAGDILSPLLDRDDVKYVGHHISADLPWIHHWLGLEWYDKCILDTEFAQQCCDEHEELSLESLALKYTDLGRYDIDLIKWKKNNKQEKTAGYAFIPDDILIPYACADVDTVIRTYPILIKEMLDQGLADYYFNIFNPFVTNVFTNFVLLGLPMDVTLLDELRELYTYSRNKLNEVLQDKIYEEAKQIIAHRLAISERTDIDSLELAQDVVCDIVDRVESGNTDEGWELLKSHLTAPEIVPHYRTLFEHMLSAPAFNIRSKVQMNRWLFDVKLYKPVKSTANREQGTLSLPWEKVLSMPEKAQKKYQPASDRQSLEILAAKHNDPLLDELLLLNSIGNICKAFLKEATVDEDGSFVQENGLHFFLCSDGRVHGHYSTTETGRPRSWKPNALNWPKSVHTPVATAIKRVLYESSEAGELPPSLEKFVKGSIPSIRSCVKAPEGWCFIESDYQTAEVRGLAFISGDQNLIDIVTKPDLQFGIDNETGNSLRLSYSDKFGISESARDASLLTPLDSPRLRRAANGDVIHPSTDLHWSLAEIMYDKPREYMEKEIERAAAKVGNFQSAYGATAETLERKIEQDTGKKPEEGTGKRILEAIAKRQPVATHFLKSMEEKPNNPGYLRAASGRLRRFATHDRMGSRAENERAAESLVSALGREARNFYMQASVADTSARAGSWLLDHYLKHDMKARPMVILYDAVVTLCPLDEAEEVARLHHKYMCDENGWEYHGRTLKYPIDNEILTRWSTKLTAEDKEYLGDLVEKIS